MYVEKERGNYMDQTYMKEQPVLKLILSMALPMVLSMMVSSLYNIVDSFFIARISEDAMTALSLVYPVQNLVNAVMIGFGIGINAVISFYLGAQDKDGRQGSNTGNAARNHSRDRFYDSGNCRNETVFTDVYGKCTDRGLWCALFKNCIFICHGIVMAAGI